VETRWIEVFAKASVPFPAPFKLFDVLELTVLCFQQLDAALQLLDRDCLNVALKFIEAQGVGMDVCLD